MRTILFAAVLALGAGCAKKSSSTDESSQHASKLPTLTVDEVDQALAKGDATPVDANGDPTRKKLGTLPGAVLLTDSETFKVSELPQDKSKELVFYCANTHC